MNMTYQLFGDLPPLTMSIEDLAGLMVSIFAENPGNYSFTSFITSISSNIIKTGTGFKAAQNTTYSGVLCQSDKGKVREIIWDMIIDRHLSIGGAGHDDWPNFTVTARGKAYFEKQMQSKKQ